MNGQYNRLSVGEKTSMVGTKVFSVGSKANSVGAKVVPTGSKEAQMAEEIIAKNGISEKP